MLARRERARPRRRALVVALAGALLVAIAAILYSTAPGEEPRAAQPPAVQRPAGPSLDERLRDAVAPALRADARLSAELSALVPGADPGDARGRARAAIPVTAAARTALRELRATTPAERLLHARAQRALGSQSAYLELVRDVLRLRVDDRQLDRLGPLSARLVSRLERIETAVPRASESVGGARRLNRWASAELAVAQAPPPAIPATPDVQPVHPVQPQVTPAPTPVATPTPAPTAETKPIATSTPTPSVDEHVEQAPPPFRRRRARLRRQLESLAAR